MPSAVVKNKFLGQIRNYYSVNDKRRHRAKQKEHAVKISPFRFWQKQEGRESVSNKLKGGRRY